MFDKQIGQPQMPPPHRAHLLAPIHLFAVAAPEGGIEAGQAAQIVYRHCHAEPDAGGGFCHGGIGVHFCRQRINRIGLTGGKRAALTKDRSTENLCVIGHGRDGRHPVMRQKRPHQARGPAFWHERIRVQQHHRVAKCDGQFQTRIDRPDETLIFAVLDHRYAARDCIRLIAQPAVDERAHAGVAGGILDQNKPPRQIGVLGHTAQNLGQQIKRVVDRHHNRDRKVHQGFWVQARHLMVSLRPGQAGQTILQEQERLHFRSLRRGFQPQPTFQTDAVVRVMGGYPVKQNRGRTDQIAQERQDQHKTGARNF